MEEDKLQNVADHLARIGCLRASIPEPVESAWSRADRFQREMLEAHIQEIPDLYPGLEEAYWKRLGRSNA
jgi:hypothetical protein